MKSVLLTVSCRYLIPLLLVLSLIVTYRGHNLPGGGFIGGLVASASVILYALAHGWSQVEPKLKPSPTAFILAGLLCAFVSGFPGMFVGHPFMTGMWFPPFELPLLGKVKIGTPLLFDIGVYFAVIGFTLKCAHSLGSNNEQWNY